MTTDVLVLGMAAAGNAAALVWGAAKMSSSVDQLKSTANKLEHFLEDVDLRVADHAVRLGVVEDRVGVVAPRRAG